MPDYNFQHQKEEWAKIPVDDIAYYPAHQLLAYPDKRLQEDIDLFEHIRYDPKGWRNKGNKWRESLGLDTTHDKVVLDFGCGFGIESLQFAKAGNIVIAADINPETVQLAQRVLKMSEYDCLTATITDKYPYVEIPPEIGQVAIFYSNGVLHHLPYIREVLQRAAEIAPETRIMVYSDKAFELYGDNFVRNMDQVGDYADWYDKEKLEKVCGDFMDIYSAEYITDNDRYIVFKMRRK